MLEKPFFGNYTSLVCKQDATAADSADIMIGVLAMKDPALQFVTQYLKSLQVPVRFLTPPCESVSWLDLGLRESILRLDGSVLDAVNRWLSSVGPREIRHSVDDFRCHYIVLRLPDSEERMVCGPVLFEEMREAQRNELFDAMKLPEDLRDRTRDYYYRLVCVPGQSQYLSLFTVLGDRLYGENQYDFTYTDFAARDEQCYDNYYRVPDQPFLGIQVVEDRYETENAVLAAVANGNERLALEHCAHWSMFILPQRLTSKLRDSKDYMITLNTLLRKTVEQAGVHPIHIDAVSNRNIQLIEQVTATDQLQSLQSQLVRTYCHLVRKHNLKDYSLLTQKIITCVDTELSADLSLKALSERLSVNASYLSTLFKKEMGLSLTEFVNRRRITHAQSLLIHTALPIKTVAQKCGIPDVYYFSRLFKRITGTTPKAYRDTAAFAQFFPDPEKVSK